MNELLKLIYEYNPVHLNKEIQQEVHKLVMQELKANSLISSNHFHWLQFFDKVRVNLFSSVITKHPKFCKQILDYYQQLSNIYCLAAISDRRIGELKNLFSAGFYADLCVHLLFFSKIDKERLKSQIDLMMESGFIDPLGEIAYKLGVIEAAAQFLIDEESNKSTHQLPEDADIYECTSHINCDKHIATINSQINAEALTVNALFDYALFTKLKNIGITDITINLNVDLQFLTENFSSIAKLLKANILQLKALGFNIHSIMTPFDICFHTKEKADGEPSGYLYRHYLSPLADYPTSSFGGEELNPLFKNFLTLAQFNENNNAASTNNLNSEMPVVIIQSSAIKELKLDDKININYQIAEQLNSQMVARNNASEILALLKISKVKYKEYKRTTHQKDFEDLVTKITAIANDTASCKLERVYAVLEKAYKKEEVGTTLSRLFGRRFRQGYEEIFLKKIYSSKTRYHYPKALRSLMQYMEIEYGIKSKQKKPLTANIQSTKKEMAHISKFTYFR